MGWIRLTTADGIDVRFNTNNIAYIAELPKMVDACAGVAMVNSTRDVVAVRETPAEIMARIYQEKGEC